MSTFNELELASASLRSELRKRQIKLPEGAELEKPIYPASTDIPTVDEEANAVEQGIASQKYDKIRVIPSR